MSECRAIGGFCRCCLLAGHEDSHECEDCHEAFEGDDSHLYCTECGKFCFGDKGTAEEALKNAYGETVCGECLEDEQ